MALKVHRVVVVGCPRCILTGEPDKLGVGKSCFCNRFVRPDSFKEKHGSMISEKLWRDSPVYNGDHFLYWGAATKRHADGTKTRLQIVEQTEFFDGEKISHKNDREYICRASATHFISRGKVAYRVLDEEEYAIPSSLKSNPMRARAVQLFPNGEFSEGKGVSGFVCLFDPTLEGENIKIQVDFLTKLINELLKTKRKIVVACTKCDEANDARIQFGANLVANIKSKKPIPFIQTSAKEGINIEEPFNYIVGQFHKKALQKCGGKNSPIMLGPTYKQLMRSRGKDESFARATFNRLIREKVTSFSSEWSKTWPYLQLDRDCSEAVEIIGISEAKKIFCQRLMALKVTEAKEKSKVNKVHREKKQDEHSKSYQSELLEAFSTHPDLINESAYDFVYSPSLPSTNSISPSPSSLVRPSSFSPAHVAIPRSGSFNSPLHQNVSFTVTPPPPNELPPICTDPDMFDYRNNGFSPTRTCLAVNSFASQNLNKSQELLSALPKIKTGIQRHSSLRYKNRTLPPLPASRPFNVFSSSTLPRSFTKSQPQLDEEGSDFDDESLSPSPGIMRRKFSTSVDCLQSISTIDGSMEGDVLTDLEASPYLRPVEVQMALRKAFDKNPTLAQGTSSMRVPQSHAHPPLPPGFLTMGRKSTHSYREHMNLYNRQTGSNPRLSEPSSAMFHTRPRSSSSPPPPPPSTLSILSPHSQQLLLSPNKVTSLDRGSRQRTPNTIGEEDSTDDNDSIISGPFAEVEEMDPLPPLMSEILKSNESLSRISNPRTSILSSVSSSLPDKDLPNGSPVEGIYASIPAVEDEQYLTMNCGISMEDLLNTPTKGVNTSSLPPPKSVIKRLQMFASRSDFDNNTRISVSPSATPKGSPSRPKKDSSGSIVPPLRVSTDYVSMSDQSTSPMLHHSWSRSSVLNKHNKRPLPQSPNKLRKAATMRGIVTHHSPTKSKNSGMGDSNIYETIDGDHAADWLKQLRSFDEIPSEGGATNRQDYNQIMKHFLSSPGVQELWQASVRTVYPDFAFPEEPLVPPLIINPTYFAGGVTQQKTETSTGSESPVDTPVESKDTIINEEDVETEIDKPSLLDGQESPTAEVTHHCSLKKKESFTDQILARFNQLHQASSSEEESDTEDDEEYSETSDPEVESDSEGEEEGEERDGEIKTKSKISLSSIRERFEYTDTSDSVIMLDGSEFMPLEGNTLKDSDSHSNILDHIPHLNGYQESWMDASKHRPESPCGVMSDEDESGTGSSSPVVLDTPSVSSVVHPVPSKPPNHLAVFHFNSLDSGISANGNICVDDSHNS